MIVFLNVLDRMRDVDFGTLQVGKNEPSGDSDGRYFEWRGKNGTSDGGTWSFSFYSTDGKWGGGNSPHTQWVMVLVSNKTKEVAAEILNSDWGLAEPVAPWFKAGSHDFINQFPPGQPGVGAFWEKM